MKALQKFSSNIRYDQSLADNAAKYSESYQNSNIILPNLQKYDQKAGWEEEVSEEVFETITEDVKDMNTSQTGKGSSQEENSHSSNLDKNRQTAGTQSDEKGVSEEPKTIKEKKKFKKVNKKKNSKKISESIVERRIPQVKEKKEEEKKEKKPSKKSKVPSLPILADADKGDKEKSRNIQTADNVRMPNLVKKVAQEKPSPIFGSAKNIGNKTRNLGTTMMYRTVNSSFQNTFENPTSVSLRYFKKSDKWIIS